MALLPYRTLGPTLERLGAVVGAHGRSKLAVLRTAILVLGLSLIALASFATAFERLAAATAEDVLSALGCLTIGAVVAATALTLFVRAVRSRDLRLEIRELGLAHRAAWVEAAMFWDDVREVRVTWQWNALRWRERHSCTLVAKDGQRLVLTDALAGIRDIRSIIERETVRRLLPSAVESVEAGRALTFGPYTVGKEGVSHQEKELTWEDVKEAVVVRGLIAIGSKTQRVRALPKRDGIMAWAKEPYADVPNAVVMIALVDRFRRA